MRKQLIATLKLMLFLVALVWGGIFAQGSVKDALYLSYEQRVILSYLLSGANESHERQLEIAQRLEQIVTRYAEMPTEVVKVSKFSDFLEIYRGQWPNSYSLESDLNLLEKSPLRGPVRFEASTKELEQEIKRFVENQNHQLAEKLGRPDLVEILTASQSLSKVPRGMLLNFIQHQNLDPEVKERMIFKGFSEVSELLNDNIKEIERTGQDIVKGGNIRIPNEGMKIFLSVAFSEYFQRLSPDSKKQIVSLYMGNNLNATQMERFESMVLASGPQFQKLLQVVARESGLSPELMEIFKKLESKASSIPAPIVRDLFEAEKENYRWVSYELKPLGTGTMAQVHRGVIETEQGRRNVVIRFLKPEIERRVQEDYNILKELAPILDNNPDMKKAGMPAIGPLVDDLNRTVTDELNLQDTINNQKKGREVYNRQGHMNAGVYKNTIEIYVPAVIESKFGNSNLMVQELIEGDKLDRVAEQWRDLAPDLKKAVVEELSKVWIEEVIFRSGFFHSDLHQGNFLVQLTEPKVRLSILDFGMSGQISKEMQKQFLTLAGGVELLKADLIADSFLKLSLKSKNTITETDFLVKVVERAKSLDRYSPDNTLSKWTVWAMDHGIKFPYNFVSLNRGLGILDKLLEESGSEKRITDLAKKMAPRYGMNIVSTLRASKKISWWDIIKLGWSRQPNPEKAIAPAEAHALTPQGLGPQLAIPIRCQAVFY